MEFEALSRTGQKYWDSKLTRESSHSTKTKELSCRLPYFEGVEHDNLSPLGEAVGNLIDGTLLTNRLRPNQSKVCRKGINQLATATLGACDTGLTAYVMKYGR